MSSNLSEPQAVSPALLKGATAEPYAGWKLRVFYEPDCCSVRLSVISNSSFEDELRKDSATNQTQAHLVVAY